MQIPDLTTYFHQIQIDPCSFIQYNKPHTAPHGARAGAGRYDRPPEVNYYQYSHFRTDRLLKE